MERTYLEMAAERYAKYVIQQARTNLTKRQNGGGNLYNSLEYKIVNKKTTDNVVVEFFMDYYGQFQDEGVKGAKSVYPQSTKSPFRYKTKMPPQRVFDKWLIKRGIAPRDKKGRFISRKSLKFLIARSIYEKGIMATFFFTKPLNRGKDKYRQFFKDALIKDIENKL